MKIDLLNRAQLSIINKNNFRYPLAIAEKDYFLAVVLKIIYSSLLREKLVFKGGTAIHHLHLKQLRFSEDLDFSSTDNVPIDEVRAVFAPYDYLEIVEHYESEFSLKINRLKFLGPLGQANSIKIDIDLKQKLILPAERADYKNIYGIQSPVTVMQLKEILAEKIRAMNERARYRDFYDFAIVLKYNSFDLEEIVGILKQKELRQPLRGESILKNLELSIDAKKSGAENLQYREEIIKDELRSVIAKLVPFVS